MGVCVVTHLTLNKLLVEALTLRIDYRKALADRLCIHKAKGLCEGWHHENIVGSVNLYQLRLVFGWQTGSGFILGDLLKNAFK